MIEKASTTQVRQAQLLVVLVATFTVAGAIIYGVSAEAFQRMWQNLLERPGGPMTFRFILQPIMVTIAAIHDGIKDAKSGRSPYFWTLLTKPSERSGRLREGLIATARVMLLGLAMDVIYQLMVLKTFYPGEAVIIAILLAFVPYLLIRGPASRIMHWWRGDAATG
jgi:hypothetical protein